MAVLVTFGCAALAASVFWLHIGIQPVLSGSMRPTYGPGWAIVTRPIPVSQVKPGDIVVFTPPGESAQFAHRVVKVSDGSTHPVITTKGDANPVPDPWHARLDSSSVPKVVGEVPWLGYVMVYMGRQWLHALLVAVLGTALCVLGTRAILRSGYGDEALGDAEASERLRLATGTVSGHGG